MLMFIKIFINVILISTLLRSIYELQPKIQKELIYFEKLYGNKLRLLTYILFLSRIALLIFFNLNLNINSMNYMKVTLIFTVLCTLWNIIMIKAIFPLTIWETQSYMDKKTDIIDNSLQIETVLSFIFTIILALNIWAIVWGIIGALILSAISISINLILEYA